MAAVPLKELSRFAPAVEFGPLALKAVSRRMVELGWCRGQGRAAGRRAAKDFAEALRWVAGGPHPDAE